MGTPPRTLTYEELGRAVEAVACELVRRGLRKDEIVVAQLPNVWELAMLYLAVGRAGGIKRGTTSNFAGLRFCYSEDFRGQIARRLSRAASQT